MKSSKPIRTEGPFSTPDLLLRATPFIGASVLAISLNNLANVTAVRLLALALSAVLILSGAWRAPWLALPRLARPIPAALALGLSGLPSSGTPFSNPVAYLSVAFATSVPFFLDVIPWGRVPRWVETVALLGSISPLLIGHPLSHEAEFFTLPIAYVVVLFVALYGNRLELISTVVIIGVDFSIPNASEPLNLAEGVRDAVLTSLIAIVAVCVFRVVSVMRSQQAVILEDHRLAEVREAWIHSVLENTAEAVVTIDVDGTIRSVNRAAREMFGRDAIALAGKPISMLITSEGQHEFGAYLVARMRHVDDGLGSGARETIGIRANLERFPIEYSAGETEQDGRKVFIVTIRDITDQKARNDALEHDAMHDRLTGLPNRALLQDRVTQALALARRNKHGMAVLMLDFNHFKEVNDQLGHEVGDGLLRELSDRMTGALRTVDTIARLGGDEFVILPADVRDAEGAERIADKVISAMSKPFVIQGNSIATGVSIGIAIYPEHGLDGDSLLRHADHVMYIAKRAGVGYSPKPPQKVNVPA